MREEEKESNDTVAQTKVRVGRMVFTVIVEGIYMRGPF